MGSATIFFWLQIPNVNRKFRTALTIIAGMGSATIFFWIEMANVHKKFLHHWFGHGQLAGRLNVKRKKKATTAAKKGINPLTDGQSTHEEVEGGIELKFQMMSTCSKLWWGATS